MELSSVHGVLDCPKKNQAIAIPTQEQLAYNYDTVEVHYCVVTMQWKFVSFECSIHFNWVQNISICGSSSAVIQNLGEHNIKTLMLCIKAFNIALP